MSIPQGKYYEKRIKPDKTKYKITNWSEYNHGLKKRGRLFLYFDEDIQNQWVFKGKRKPGGKQAYSDIAIELCLTIKKLYHLPLRQTQGFLEDIVTKLALPIHIPDYTRLSRRGRTLKLNIKRPSKENQPFAEDTHIIIDSTGLKMFGESEWQWAKHKKRLIRSWMKLHIAVNKQGEIAAVALTDNHTDDPSQVSNLLDQIDNPIIKVIADGAYDRFEVYGAILEKAADRPIKIVIPPRRNAMPSLLTDLKQRDEHIEYRMTHGEQNWEFEKGYTQQSRVENTMGRFKQIHGGKLVSRHAENQKTEVIIGCNILNKMTAMGMPMSSRIS